MNLTLIEWYWPTWMALGMTAALVCGLLVVTSVVAGARADSMSPSPPPQPRRRVSLYRAQIEEALARAPWLEDGPLTTEPNSTPAEN